MEFKGTKVFNVDYHTTGVLPYKYVVSDIQETEEEAEANALLISKAPEMLEMLKSCMKSFEQMGMQKPIGIEQLIKEATELNEI